MSAGDSRTKPQGRLFRLKTHPAVHAVVHGTRRRRGQLDVRRLPPGRTTAETAVRRALHAALHGEAGTSGARRIEQVRADYLRSDLRLSTARTGKTSTLAGAASVSRSPRDAWLLHELVRELQASSIVETGTCVGISAAYQAVAMPEGGRLLTLELCDDLAEQARRTFTAVGVADRAEVVVGDIDDTLDGVVEGLSGVDFAFVDGGHRLDAVLRETELFLRRAHPGTVLAYDDIDWTDEMRQAWRRITADARFGECFDLGAMGLAVVGESGLPTRVFRVHYA